MLISVLGAVAFMAYSDESVSELDGLQMKVVMQKVEYQKNQIAFSITLSQTKPGRWYFRNVEPILISSYGDDHKEKGETRVFIFLPDQFIEGKNSRVTCSYQASLLLENCRSLTYYFGGSGLQTSISLPVIDCIRPNVHEDESCVPRINFRRCRKANRCR